MSLQQPETAQPLAQNAENPPACLDDTRSHLPRLEYLLDILMILVVLLGAYLRFTGWDWGEYTYMHPDERFLVMVGSSISPVNTIGEYFDTAVSSLNPHNRGYGFYVYGTFPLFLTRYIAEWTFKNGGLQEVMDVGRPLSALFDLLTVLLIYIVGAKAYGKRTGLLAAAFLAVAVLPIQLSHYFKEDTFLNFFTLLAIYFALRILMDTPSSRQPTPLQTPSQPDESDPAKPSIPDQAAQHIAIPTLPPFWLFAGFGIALGLAVACKLNTAPVAALLPAAILLRFGKLHAQQQKQLMTKTLLFLAGAALISLLVFRIFQPYAFSGPGFFGVKPNPLWVDNIREQRAQAEGDVDFPPAMQWARRSFWFAGENLVTWGLGLPLGILAMLSFLWIGWKLLPILFKRSQIQANVISSTEEAVAFRNLWKEDLLLWGWTAFYFLWQSSSFNPTMRYLLPIYPLLALFAARGVFMLWDWGRENRSTPVRFFAILIGSGVFLATFAYAFAFLQIYVTPFTRVDASRWIYQNVPGPLNLHITTDKEVANQPLPFPYEAVITPGAPYVSPFVPHYTGQLSEIHANSIFDKDAFPSDKTLTLSISEPVSPDKPLTSATIRSDFLLEKGIEGNGYTFLLNPPIIVEKGKPYNFILKLEGDGGALNLRGAAIANEGDWDDSLPLRVDDYDGFGGIYPGDLAFNMYWDDNPEKLARFLNILDETEYIIITSNRQWGTLPRIPERFPLTSTYYRNLLGCPEDKTIEWCYRVAKPGTFQGKLGFDLIKISQSNPHLGPLSLNDQFAEEAFTVYDHPKVLIFRKTPQYSSLQVNQILSSVDLTRVIHVTPKRASARPLDLMLPPDRLAEQRAGGTWAELFNVNALHNRFEFLGIIVWYVFIASLGLLAYPLTRLAFYGMQDMGYPLARMVGLLLLAYLAWLGGSYRIPFTRLTISLIVILIAASGVALAWFQRNSLRQEWRERRKYFLTVEMVALIAFLIVLIIRWGNPDLWHPWKGGEKPMDFSYFNAIIKSTSFPPFDPWFAGGYLNYYYYGFVIFAVPVKLLGIVPAFAYNLILASVFSLIVLGAFCIGWNLRQYNRLFSGIATALGIAVLGNLGTWRMIFRGFQMLVAPHEQVQNLPNSLTEVFIRWNWALQGFVKAISGETLPYGIADWYWNPSRAIAPLGDVEPITEFPFFTILYADPHAHLFAIPVALLALAWTVSVVLGKGWHSEEQPTPRRVEYLLRIGLGVFVGSLAIGALRPTNTWDFPTYLTLGILATLYAIWRTRRPRRHAIEEDSTDSPAPLPARWQTIVDLSIPLSLLLLSFLLYHPFARWFGQAYTAIEVWKGPRTPLPDYITHWGLFLFLIISWLVYETIDWMATTPLSHIRKLAPYRTFIVICLASILLVTIILGVKMTPSESLIKLPFDAGFLLFSGVQIAWLAIPLGAWVIVLLLRPNQSDIKRAVLFLIGSGLALTIFVEIFVLRGDVGRMNTVFKFYLQTWVFFGVSAAASFGWILDATKRTIHTDETHHPNWMPFWQAGVIVLVCAAALYPIMATPAKMRDRMMEESEHTLDGMAYMQDATYYDQDREMDLSEDYNAIRWMQENIKGSPVIVEGNTPEYRWGSRYSIYTGLPGVVGWNWHQRQQRGFVSTDWVTNRVAEIADFYNTPDPEEAKRFVDKYDVSYIIVGQLEQAYHPGAGLDKFKNMDGVLWKAVYDQGDTVIYQVNDNQ